MKKTFATLIASAVIFSAAFSVGVASNSKTMPGAGISPQATQNWNRPQHGTVAGGGWVLPQRIG